jgi:hypothetical protein
VLVGALVELRPGGVQRLPVLLDVVASGVGEPVLRAPVGGDLLEEALVVSCWRVG